MSIPKPILLNFENLRKSRQQNNNLIVFNCIKDDNIKEFNKHINQKELTRLLENLEIKFDDLWKKCRSDDMFAKLTASHLSKKASRQCSKDEDVQIKTCNITSQLCGINIELLPNTQLRPTKDGKIISKKDMIKNKISKDNCLKSFDAKITGKINGYISAKVSFGNGGHQDNVFEEMDILAKWWEEYKSKSEDYLIILIDTDLNTKMTNLQKKYKYLKNLKILDHIGVQNYVIEHYYTDDDNK